MTLSEAAAGKCASAAGRKTSAAEEVQNFKQKTDFAMQAESVLFYVFTNFSLKSSLVSYFVPQFHFAQKSRRGKLQELGKIVSCFLAKCIGYQDGYSILTDMYRMGDIKEIGLTYSHAAISAVYPKLRILTDTSEIQIHTGLGILYAE